MNLLIDLAPKMVMVDGLECEIKSNFRTGILFEQLGEERSLSPEQKADIALNLYYPIVPPNRIEALNKILWFYRCGKDVREVDGKAGKGETKGQIFSYDHDDAFIYSAFLQQYGIDLQDIDYLHWWKFRAMFSSLMECKFTDIIGYRSMKITNDMPKSQQQFYKKMKRLYSLPDNRTQEEKEADLMAEFMKCF